MNSSRKLRLGKEVEPETDPTVPAHVKAISTAEMQEWVDGFNNNIISGTVTGDNNKTITLTKRNGTTLSIPFIDNTGTVGDDVLNTLNFDNTTGVLTAITSEGIQITANFDGRYSLLGHTHPEYDHPVKAWVDKTTLTGASVISNLTVDSKGHPTGWSVRALTPANIGAEPAFEKNTAFNRNFGGNGIASTVSRSDHYHRSRVDESIISSNIPGEDHTNDKWLHYTGDSDTVLGIGTSTTSNFPKDSEIEGSKINTGTLTIQAGPYTTLLWPEGLTNVIPQNGVFGIKFIEDNVGILFGTLIPE